MGDFVGASISALGVAKVRTGVRGVGEKVIFGLDIGLDVGFGVGFKFGKSFIMGVGMAVREADRAADDVAVVLTVVSADGEDYSKFVGEIVGLNESWDDTVGMAIIPPFAVLKGFPRLPHARPHPLGT